MNKVFAASLFFALAGTVACSSSNDSKQSRTITGNLKGSAATSLTAADVKSVMYVTAQGVAQSVAVANGAFSITVPADISGILLFKDAQGHVIGNLVAAKSPQAPLTAAITAGAAVGATIDLGSITFDAHGMAVAAININTLIDGDLDGIPEYTDTDDDGDGVADEADDDCDGDGFVDDEVDADSDDDGMVDPLDSDDDNDGVDDSVDADDDGDGIPDVADLDSDGDGLPDSLDIDDADGLGDLGL